MTQVDGVTKVREEMLDNESVVVLENGSLRAAISPARGAGILDLTHMPSGEHILWRAPGGLREPGKSLPAEFDSSTSFFDYYPGGCQIILPNGGPSSRHNGVELGFHGEACKIAWFSKIDQTDEAATITCTTSLRRVPIDAVVCYTLPSNASSLRIQTMIRNTSDAPVTIMWGLHPAYGEPLLGPRTRLHIRAGEIEAHPVTFAHRQNVPPGFMGRWPKGPGGLRLDYVFDGLGLTADLVYLKQTGGWYVLHNEETGLAATLTWDAKLFPFVWLWQECRDESGYPWFGRYHIVGVEPFTSFPSLGLTEAMKRGTALNLNAREVIATEFRLGATQLPSRYDLTIVGVDKNGSVNFKEGDKYGQ